MGKNQKLKISKMEKILTEGKRCLFLDRDGVINRSPEAHSYIKNWQDFELLPDVIPSIRLAKEKGWMVIIITNQRGVGRGLMDKDEVNNIHENLNILLNKKGTYIDDFFGADMIFQIIVNVESQNLG